MLREALVALTLPVMPWPSTVPSRSAGDVRPAHSAGVDVAVADGVADFRVAGGATMSLDVPTLPRRRQPDGELGWDGSRPRFVPPVDAPVADPFRAPEGPFGPGNRGIEYATAPGTPVRAIGTGVVAFAGPVAGRGVVSVDHPSGLRSTYTGLAAIAVAPGVPVAQGQVVGSTAGHLHLGLRDGRRYLDPAAFFGGARAVLVE